MDENGAVPEYSGKWWMKKIRAREAELDKVWRTSAEKVQQRFLDRREDDNGTSKYNIFWANVGILKSALYANPPKPAVKRMFDDAKDDVARVAALILERILFLGVNADGADMHTAFKHAVEDRLIPGMGQVWVRYEAEVEEIELPPVQDPLTGAMQPPLKTQQIVEEEVCTDFIHWNDFLWSPARVWEEVTWVAKRVWMEKEKVKKRFGEEKYKELVGNLQSLANDTTALPKGFRDGRVEVYEVWCKTTKKVYWCSDVMEGVLETRDDPLDLDNFFPCPKPLLATHTTNDLAPRPDYVMVQDQYDELDTLNARISLLTKALRVVGLYDSGNPELKRLLSSAHENDMIPVDSWAAFAERGGMKGAIDWFPVDVIAGVLDKLMLQRQACIGQIYELTGISDIMRGASNPRETAKAQTLKAQYSSVRLQLTQQDVAEFLREALRIKAEVICKHMQPETILRMSQIESTESAPLAPQAVQLLKQFEIAEYRLDIGEESLSLADYNAERELRIEFVTAFGQFLSQSAQMVTSMPGALPYLLRILQWVVASFRGSADVETVIDEAVTALQSMPAAPQGQQAAPPPPDHSVEVAQIKAEADKQIAQVKVESEERIAQMKIQAEQQIAQMREQYTQVNEQQRTAAQGAQQAAATDSVSAVLEKITAALEQQGQQIQQIQQALEGLAPTAGPTV